MSDKCGNPKCTNTFEQGQGRPRKYCSLQCRNYAYRRDPTTGQTMIASVKRVRDQNIYHELANGMSPADAAKKFNVHITTIYNAKHAALLKHSGAAKSVEEVLSHITRTPAPALDTQVGGAHYKNMNIQPVTFIYENNIPFIEGNAITYLCRWRAKGGVEDLKKARHFIDLLIQLEGEK